MPIFTFAMLRKGMPKPKGTRKQRRRTWQRRLRRLEKAWVLKDEFSDIFRTTPQNFVFARGIRLYRRRLRPMAKIVGYAAPGYSEVLSYSEERPRSQHVVWKAADVPKSTAWQMWQDLKLHIVEERRKRPGGAVCVAVEGRGLAWVDDSSPALDASPVQRFAGSKGSPPLPPEG